MTLPSRLYCLITPCRDEAAYARRTLDSVVAQTVTPALWLIVDDGSTDETPKILAEYAARHSWIRVLTRKNRGKRAVGPGVIEAFYAGYGEINPGEYAYLCKLDLDLDLPHRYFETLIERMEAEPRLGTFSGKPYVETPQGPQPEPSGDEMSVGMTKFYRTACFRQIGGFVREVMWDGIDCHRARMLGWIAGCADDIADLRFLHLRPMGSSQKSIFTGRQRHGFGQYFMGTGPLYMAASSVYRFTHPPYVLGGALMFWGWLKSAWQRLPRYPDLRFRRFLNSYQWQMLFGGKRRATADINARQALAWNPRREPAAEMGGAPSPAFPRIEKQWPTVTLDHVPIHITNEPDCVAQVLRALDEKRGGWVVTYNTDILRRYRKDPAFAELVQPAGINTADGMPLLWAARLAGVRLPGRVCGSDLVESLSAAAAQAGRCVFLLGGNPGMAAAAGRVLKTRHPRLSLAGELCPPFGFEHDAAAMAELHQALIAARPDIVFVALGCPKQEWLIEQLRADLPQAWFLGVGIAFSFLAGEQLRAPSWMRGLGLEWLHRMAQEPGRLFRRYVLDDIPYALGLLLRTAWRRMLS